ncbi:MAG: thermonuclease family protein [Salinibacter sp.]
MSPLIRETTRASLVRTSVLWFGAVLLACLFGFPPKGRGQAYVGKVHRVVDGDTIHLLRGTGKIVRIQLYGVDAPEQGQPFGAAATRAVRRAVFRERTEAVARGHDEEGRPLFVVSVGDRRLNEQLIRDGLAWWDRRQAPTEDRLRRLEKKAQVAERGLWAQPTPVPPWTWRAQRRDR